MLLIRHPRHPERLLTRRCRSWDRLWARLLAPSLDRRLAAGRSPDSGRLLATRAQILVSPVHRRRAAHHWEHLLEVALSPPGPGHGAIPLCRDRIEAAEPAMRQMLTALVASLPVPAGAVAMAGLLLSDGAGPLYNRRCCTDLPSAMGRVTAELRSSASLVASA